MSPSAIDNAPPGPKVPLFSPPPPTVRGGAERRPRSQKTPPARVPSALYTSSLMVVVAGVCDDDTARRAANKHATRGGANRTYSSATPHSSLDPKGNERLPMSEFTRGELTPGTGPTDWLLLSPLLLVQKPLHLRTYTSAKSPPVVVSQSDLCRSCANPSSTTRPASSSEPGALRRAVDEQLGPIPVGGLGRELYSTLPVSPLA